MELIRNTLKTENKYFSGTLRTLVENDVVVPQNKPDIGKILQVDSNSYIVSSEVRNGRVTIFGKVDFCILYLPEKGSGCIKSMRCSCDFTDVKEVSGADEDMISIATCETESVSFRVINGRKVNVKAEVLTKIKVYSLWEQEAVCGVEEHHLELKCGEVSYISFDKTVNRKFTISDIIAIPVSEPLAEDVVKVNVSTDNFSAKTINNKVVLKGNINTSVVYVVSGKDELNVFKSQLPFTEVVEAEGIEENMKSIITLSPMSVEYDIKGDDAGNINAINLKADINAKIRGIREEKQNIISDGYCPDKKTELVKEKMKISSVVDTVTKQIALKEIVYAEGDAPEISKIYDVECDVFADEVVVDSTGVTVSATAEIYVLYISDNKELPINNLHKEVKINEKIKCANVKPECICDIELSATDISFNVINENSVEVNFNIGAEGIVYDERIISPVVDITLSEETEKKPSLTVYFADEGEELWNVAKKYGASVDVIKEINKLSDNVVLKGTRLIIPKIKKSF